MSPLYRMTPSGEHRGLPRVAVISTSTRGLLRVAGPDRPRYDEETVREAAEELGRRGRAEEEEGRRRFVEGLRRLAVVA